MPRRVSLVLLGLAAGALGALTGCAGGSERAESSTDVVDATEPADVRPDAPPPRNPCPVAVIRLDEGPQVVPQTVLHLNGQGSHSAAGEIVTFEWSVVAVAGSVSVLVPDAAHAAATFEANLAGTYTFQLRVWDATGTESCVPAAAQVAVVPDSILHVELLWTTPGDDDPTDEGPSAGTDLDLHFAHPYAAMDDLDGDGAPDPWFSAPYDCYWFNRSPDWGSLDPNVDDDPSLDRDDTDGGGPENLNLQEPQVDPQAPFVYRVGVHYWDDHGFGPAFATLRVYVYSTLVLEVPDVELHEGDLWDAATIEWPSAETGLVLAPDGSWHITASYPPPGAVQP